MTGQELATEINRQLAEAGYKQGVYAIGPASIPIPIQALLPAGFRVIINLVPINNNDQLNDSSTIHQK